ncbi:hypothetical protein [Halothiobacillus sp.]|uniref:hypothetical protein n=1 Tax=Halothiobacillus sp. TaxID=1891311 RepID=UPI00260C86A5|nr:hypothetical protein [Halothiobacillus sp.]
MNRPHTEKNRLQMIQSKLDHWLNIALTMLRQVFVLLMIIYTAICVISFAIKLSALSFAEGPLAFSIINQLLTDGLYVLIVLAIVKSLFLKNSFDYAVTLLETGFVVLIRKLILLPTDPTEWKLLLILGATSTLFFVLIIVTYYYRRKWLMQDQARRISEKNPHADIAYGENRP